MPAMMDAPEVVAYKDQDFEDKQPQVGGSQGGFWRTVVQYMRQQSVHRLRRTSPSLHGPLHRIDTPAEWLARAYPTLYMRVW